MASLRPFRALRPTPSAAPRVAAPPYDVVSAAEARALVRGNADSFLYVSRPEVAFGPEVDEHDDRVYAQGPVALASFVERGVLARDAEPQLYVYELTMGAHVQTGLVGCVSAREYDDGTVRRHEQTRADKEEDRVRHLEALGAHDEPVFLTYRASAAVDALVAQVTATEPAYDFRTADEVRHRFWLAGSHTPALVAALGEVPRLYIADGHHRSAASGRLARGVTEGSERSWFPAVLFPHDQVQILPYHRLVRDPKKRSPEELLAALRATFDLREASTATPPGEGSFGFLAGGRWWHGAVRAGSYDAKDPVASLDCALLQSQLLEPLFGITDPRRDRNIDFVGGIRGTGELERRVREEGWHLAVAMHPTSVEQLFRVSDAELLMPPKSTWFEPKLRSGLFVHTF